MWVYPCPRVDPWVRSTSPAEVLEVDGTIKLSGESATYKITNVLDPTAAQDVATKAYVDAQGGGCYSKCADSGTSAGGATPSCPGGYSSVDTWSERSGFGQYQWGGMNSDAHSRYFGGTHTNTNFYGWEDNGTYNWDAMYGVTNISGYLTSNQSISAFAAAAWNTGYGSGSGSTSYYNDCTACCAD